jgi:dTMP kinase
LIAEVVQLATGGLKPDLTLIFDLSVAECAARTRRRSTDESSADRLDSEDAAFHTRVRNAYLRIAAAEPERVRLVNATAPINETHALVLDIVLPYLKSRGWKLGVGG